MCWKKLTLNYYSGKVYCVSVPSGFIYVRRNGLVHVWDSYSMGCILKLWDYGIVIVMLL